MTNTHTELKHSIERLEEWERLADLAEEAWDQDPLNEDREWAFNHYQDLKWHEFLFAAHLIYILADGKLSEKEARSIARNSTARKRITDII
jgi:hypothetical protein